MRIVSNETRGKLKKMGLSQKTMFVWVSDEHGTRIETRKGLVSNDYITIEPVYDLSFFVEALPDRIKPKDLYLYLVMVKYYAASVNKDLYFFRYDTDDGCFTMSQMADADKNEMDILMDLSRPNPTEAAAQLLFYIVEQGYAEIKNGKVVAS